MVQPASLLLSIPRTLNCEWVRLPLAAAMQGFPTHCDISANLGQVANEILLMMWPLDSVNQASQGTSRISLLVDSCLYMYVMNIMC